MKNTQSVLFRFSNQHISRVFLKSTATYACPDVLKYAGTVPVFQMRFLIDWKLIRQNKYFLFGTSLMDLSLSQLNYWCYFNNCGNNFVMMMMMMMMMMMKMNCFCGMVDQRKAFSLISSRDPCQRFSPWWISDSPWAGFEPVQNLSSGFVE